MKETKTYKGSMKTRDTDERLPIVTPNRTTDSRQNSSSMKKPEATNETDAILSDALVTTAQAAAILNVDARTVRNYITRGIRLMNGTTLYLPARQVRSIQGLDQYNIHRQDIERFRAVRKAQATRETTFTQLTRQTEEEEILTKPMEKMIEEEISTQLAQHEREPNEQSTILAALQAINALSKDNRIIVIEMQNSIESIIMKLLDRIGEPKMNEDSLLQQQPDPEESVKQQTPRSSRFLFSR